MSIGLPGRLGFRAGLGRRFTPLRGALQWHGVAPWTLYFECEAFPLQFGEHGVYAYEAHRLSTPKPLGWGKRYRRYNDLNALATEGVILRSAAQPFLTAPSADAAVRYRDAISHMTKATDHARVKERKKLYARRFDTKALQKRLATTRRLVLPLRIFSTLLAFYCIAYLYAIIVDERAMLLWRLALAIFLVLLSSVLIYFHHGHRKLYPDAVGERWQRLFSMLLAFPAAWRAPSLLTRHAFNDFHWLAVAVETVPKPTAGALADAYMRALRHPDRGEWMDPDPEVRAAQDLARREIIVTVERFISARHLNTPARSDAPSPNERHCPRCRAAYTQQADECADCGVPLEPCGPPTASPSGSAPF